MAEPSRVVVDAGVLLAYLNQEDERFEKSRDLLQEAEDGEVELWAPAVLLVEVLRWSVDADPSDREARGRLDEWLDSGWLHIVEVDRRMAKVARDVVSSTTVTKGVDALYLAAAVIVGAEQVFSWDERIIGAEYEGVIGVAPWGSQSPRLDLP